MYQARPLTSSCARRQAMLEHVCVGISPFNGYFNATRINGLTKWAFSTFPQAHFFVPDEAAAYTLMALGYPEDKAKHKARRQGQYVINKVRTGMAECGITDSDDLILSASALRENQRYRELAVEARQRFDDDPMFREDIMTTSAWVLQGRLPDGQAPTEEQKMLGVQYFLDELPLFVDTPGIVGVERSVFVYHQQVRFLERFYRGEMSWKPVPGQSFMIVTEATDDDAADGTRTAAEQLREEAQPVSVG